MTAAAPGNQFQTDLVELVPFLRSFARSLCGDPEMADDLAQETLVKAWQARAMFQPGMNLKAWLFTILRNQFYSDRQRAWRQESWDQTAAERIPAASDEQSWAAELTDTARALSLLSENDREALILVGAGGFSFEDAASICHCAVGTMRGRVARARRKLLSFLEGDHSLHRDAAMGKKDAANDIVTELDKLAPDFWFPSPRPCVTTAIPVAIVTIPDIEPPVPAARVIAETTEGSVRPNQKSTLRKLPCRAPKYREPSEVERLLARQRAIGKEMRKHFAAVTREQLPSEMQAILAQLDGRSKCSSASATNLSLSSTHT